MIDAEMRNGRIGAGERASRGSESDVIHDPYEQERTRLSRELHDDIAQRIALLSAGVGILRQLLTDASGEIQQHVAIMATEIVGIGSDLQRIARGLHPARLERLGLVASLRRYCLELADAHGIMIDVELGEVPTALGHDAGLCVYRIAQEALHNIVKHSGARHATVNLRPVPAGLVLRIVDDGVGFEPETACLKDALGLRSMRERARLADAELLVSSTSGTGTVIEVRVPVRQPFACTAS